MISSVEASAGRVIGRIEHTAAERFVVLLHSDAPSAVALNSGRPVGFPRINGYVLIPNEKGSIVCLIASVRTERLSGLRQRKEGDDIVNFPYALRLADVMPIGTLAIQSTADELSYSVYRGVDVFPSIGDVVLLPNAHEMRAIISGGHGGDAERILIGHGPTAEMAPVYVDPDKLFGRHLAILGNTGSGKSCSVAGLVRWSLESAKRERKRRGYSGRPNARFIILDPNGEYGASFHGQDTRLFTVKADGSGRRLKVPAWLWSGEEWAAFTDAAPGVQRPVLLDALKHLRNGLRVPDSFEAKIGGMAKRASATVRLMIADADHQRSGRREGLASYLETIGSDFKELSDRKALKDEALKGKLTALASFAIMLEKDARGKSKGDGQYWHDNFSELKLTDLAELLDDVSAYTGAEGGVVEVGADCPRYFFLEDLPLYVEALSSAKGGRDMAAFVDSLSLRIQTILNRDELAPVLRQRCADDFTLEDWLNTYVGEDGAKGGPVAVVDLSLVPSEVVHVVVSVLARMIFEATQRFRRESGDNLPTTLILEEAHTFVHRDQRSESSDAAARTCVKVFEKIAREGRKFGLGLVLASQRPSEVAPTVLSQCNTFLLHRLVNDRDQDLVRRLVPDGLGSLLRELPSLPTRRAMLLGWAVPVPVLVEVAEVPKEQRPHSPDPDLWDVWVGEKERAIDWKGIARQWQGMDGLDGPRAGEE